ncbi:hypothetical protein Tco_0080271 [Tanacetum coccineum]
MRYPLMAISSTLPSTSQPCKINASISTQERVKGFFWPGGTGSSWTGADKGVSGDKVVEWSSGREWRGSSMGRVEQGAFEPSGEEFLGGPGRER